MIDRPRLGARRIQATGLGTRHFQDKSFHFQALARVQNASDLAPSN
jgi:hypothetical protein